MEPLGTATWPVQPRGGGRVLREVAEIQSSAGFAQSSTRPNPTARNLRGTLGLLADWLDAEPEVLEGKWFKRFSGMIVCGEGELVKTFLAANQIPIGTEFF